VNAVLVTGGAGYVGSHVCKALASAGFLPVAFDDLSKGHRWAVRWGPLETGDVRDADALDAVLARHRPAAAVHLAALSDVADSLARPYDYADVNVRGTAALLDALDRAGVGPLVFSGTCAAYGEAARPPIPETAPLAPTNPYGRSKAEAEARIAARRARSPRASHAVLRYFNVAGADPEGLIGEWHEPETHLIPRAALAASGRTPELAVFGTDWPTADGSCVRDYVHPDDVAAAHVQALRRLIAGGEPVVCNVGAGIGTSVLQALDAVGRAAGRPVPRRFAPRRPGDVAELVADVSLARRELGWRPASSDLGTVVRTAWAWTSRMLAEGPPAGGAAP